MTAPIPDPAVPTAPDGDSDRAQLQPGNDVLRPRDRVLLEAVVEKGRDHLWLQLFAPDGVDKWSRVFDPSMVRWHLDDRAERDAERNRLAVELAEVRATAMRKIAALEKTMRGGDAQLDEARRERNSLQRSLKVEYERGDRLKAQRDAALAQVAAMRDVVKAAEAVVDAKTKASRSLDERVAQAKAFYYLIVAVDAWRSGQTAPLGHPSATDSHERAAVVPLRVEGSTGTTAGRTGVCSADGNNPCPPGTPNCPPGCPRDPRPPGMLRRVDFDIDEEVDRA